MTSKANEPTASGTGALLDFRVPGVIIWSDSHSGSIQKGLGYPGQYFYNNYDGDGGPYTCDNGKKTTYWCHGTNGATQVTGWVASCNLVTVDGEERQR